MHIVFLVLILIVCLLLILTVLAQNPKGGMAANFGASNQVMGARQTTDFLEKFTWGLAIALVVFCLGATMTMPRGRVETSKSQLEQYLDEQAAGMGAGTQGIPNLMDQMNLDRQDEQAGEAPAAEAGQTEEPAAEE
ncbi:preprotein translocase subunit SecG [Alistipes sp. OttesenSCG-928-B03]|nr:preprotein translocase subunit SecG [Alistipes sp. OttesenSCG-928-B03]